MDQGPSSTPSASVPRQVGAQAERLLAARGDPERLARLFGRSRLPMLLIDNDRRYLDANAPAQLAFRQTVEQLRLLRVDDLTPDDFLPRLQEYWERMMQSGVVAGPYEVASPAGTRFRVVYYAAADALPGQHLIVFVPSGWTDFESHDGSEPADPDPPLTPRELEVLELAAEGQSGPHIAESLVVSPATVRTHFEHIYAKLGVNDRAGSVAKAMRLGLIE